VDSEVFRQKGGRLTAQRELILQILSECSGHVARKDIYDRVHAQLPMVNWSTISNTLEVLEKLGVVRHVHEPDGTMRYHRAEDHLHLHLVCHTCGQLIELADVAVGDLLHQTLLDRFGFDLDLTHFPLAGRCSSCSEKAPRGVRP
jgi:Fur family transcriptional regulator, ferric uptake regulator